VTSGSSCLIRRMRNHPIFSQDRVDLMTCSGTVRAGASEPALAHQRQQDVDIVQSEFPSNSEQTSPLFVCNASLL
jgi:hypothetical protein